MFLSKLAGKSVLLDLYINTVFLGSFSSSSLSSVLSPLFESSNFSLLLKKYKSQLKKDIE